MSGEDKKRKQGGGELGKAIKLNYLCPNVVRHKYWTMGLNHNQPCFNVTSYINSMERY